MKANYFMVFETLKVVDAQQWYRLLRSSFAGMYALLLGGVVRGFMPRHLKLVADNQTVGNTSNV